MKSAKSENDVWTNKVELSYPFVTLVAILLPFF
jgi:hypothetical protein